MKTEFKLPLKWAKVLEAIAKQEECPKPHALKWAIRTLAVNCRIKIPS